MALSNDLDETTTQACRAKMVERQLAGRNIRDPRVLRAMATLPRESFVPESVASRAYEDCPLPIGHGQTISQPYIVALMLEALELTGTEKVLEVGGGSGYQAALLGLLAKEVYSVEVVPALAGFCKRAIVRAGVKNVKVVLWDGSKGYEPAAPYDAIVVAAAARQLPLALVSQLVEGGRLVIPIGEQWGQMLYRLRKQNGRLETEAITPCAFVPLVSPPAGPVVS